MGQGTWKQEHAGHVEEAAGLFSEKIRKYSLIPALEPRYEKKT
jgi:hypothetical protein